MCDWMNLKW